MKLKDKAISIHGKKYILVSDRVVYFNEHYPNGSIMTQIIKDADNRVVVKAKVTPDCDKPDRYFTGISASNPAKTIEAQVPHEVAETSAVGRALGFLGIGVIDGIASVDEINKATNESRPRASGEATELIHEPIDCTVDHDKLPILTVNKEGKNKGRTFKSCPKCKKFFWVT